MDIEKELLALNLKGYYLISRANSCWFARFNGSFSENMDLFDATYYQGHPKNTNIEYSINDIKEWISKNSN